MDPARLIYMADQIARNLAASGEKQAAAATADHIRQFWDPRMKRAILGADRALLPPTVAAALDLL